MEPSSPSRSFLLFRSSLHFSQNMRIISRLRLTGHPLILLSAVLSKSLHKLPSAFILPEEVLRMKGGWKGGDTMFIHYRTPINRAFQRLMKGEREKSLKSQVCFWFALAVNGFIAIGKPSREAWSLVVWETLRQRPIGMRGCFCFGNSCIFS